MPFDGRRQAQRVEQDRSEFGRDLPGGSAGAVDRTVGFVHFTRGMVVHVAPWKIGASENIGNGQGFPCGSEPKADPFEKNIATPLIALRKGDGEPMNITLSLAPLVSLVAGILILVVPRLLNYIVAAYLIVVGILGLFGDIRLR